jgi:hypothetical protein
LCEEGKRDEELVPIVPTQALSTVRSWLYPTLSAACVSAARVPGGHLLQVQVMFEDMQHLVVNGAGAMHTE